MRSLMKHVLLLGNQGAAAEPFTPGTIAGLMRWYQVSADNIAAATDGSGAVSNGGAVAYWKDLSGNDQHATQADEAKRLLYRTAHAVMGEAVESVSADYMAWTTALNLQDFTLFVDVSVDAFAALDYSVFVGSSAGSTNVIGVYTEPIISVSTSGASYNISGSALSTGTRYIVAIRRAGTAANNISAYINGSLYGTASGNNAVQAIDQLFARHTAGNSLDGAVKAVLIWNVALTDPQLQAVHDFLAL